MNSLNPVRGIAMPSLHFGKPAILVADDDSDDLFLLKEAFSEVAPQVEFRGFESGVALLNHLLSLERKTSLRPQIILLDLNMPYKNGFEILREIKQNPVLKSIPVIILTTSEDVRTIQESYMAGANSFISKPVYFNDILEMVKSTLSFWFKVGSVPHPRNARVAASTL
jgi:CheY-like chemotaxis protein